MIGKVSAGQSVRAVILAALLMFTVVGGFFGSCGYYFFGYPGKVARQALASVVPGQSLDVALSDDSEFMRLLGMNKSSRVITFGNEPKEGAISDSACGHLTLYSSGSAVYEEGSRVNGSGTSGSRKDDDSPFMKSQKGRMREFFKRYSEKIRGCTIVSATFMPALFYRCTGYVEYGPDLKVVGTRKIRCWD